MSERTGLWNINLTFVNLQFLWAYFQVPVFVLEISVKAVTVIVALDSLLG